MVDNSLVVNVFSPVAVIPPDNMNGDNYDSSKVGMEYDLSGGVTQGNLFCNFQLYPNLFRVP